MRACPFTRCTGKGATDYNAHVCTLAEPVQLSRGPCSINGCDQLAVDLLPAGRRCRDHMPDQPTTGPPVKPDATPPPPREYGDQLEHDPTARPWCATCGVHDVQHRHRKSGRRG